MRQSSKPQPFLTLAATAHPEDYRALGCKPITPQPKTITISAMGGTGCQSCLGSIKVIRCLGLCEDDLIPITMHMHTANNKLGAIISRFTDRSPSGQIIETPDKLFLSQETCTALRMISENFPTVGETIHLSKAMAQLPHCSCSPRRPPPHHLHYPMGAIPIQNSTPGVHRIR